jgi:FixJ family two-component response regulator
MANANRIVAVVDDDTSLLSAIERLLDSRPWITRTFRSGEQFLASLADGLPDCLILDLQMPGLSGLQVQEALIDKGIKIPTIIVTSNMDATMREQCVSAGAVAYLTKPVRGAELIAAIESASSVGSS